MKNTDIKVVASPDTRLNTPNFRLSWLVKVRPSCDVYNKVYHMCRLLLALPVFSPLDILVSRVSAGHPTCLDGPLRLTQGEE